MPGRSWSFRCSSASLSSEGYDVDFVANITDVNDKIYAAALQAGVDSAELAREMTDAYVADTDALGLGRPDHEPRASETIGPIVELIERVDRERACLCGRRRRLLFGPQLPGIRRNIPSRHRSDGSGRGRRGRRTASAIRSTSRSGRRTSQARTPSWDSPWGRGPAGLAHRVLGDGGADRSGSGSRSTVAAATCSFPTTRTRPPRRSPRTASRSTKLWVHNGMVRHRPRQDVQVGRQRVRAARGARALRSRRAADVLLRRPITASRSSSTTSAWRRPRRAARGSARPRAA